MTLDNFVYIRRDLTEIEYNSIVQNNEYIAIDTETTGLNPLLDDLCLIQIAANKKYYLIRYDNTINYKNLIKLLTNEKLYKVFHHAIFDVRFLMKNLNIGEVNNIICTKISTKILNGINEKSSLKDLLFKYLGISIYKNQQLSDWSKENLTNEQIEYAINDVKFLVNLWKKLEKELIKENLITYAQDCFNFISTQAFLNNKGIKNIFDY